MSIRSLPFSQGPGLLAFGRAMARLAFGLAALLLAATPGLAGPVFSAATATASISFAAPSVLFAPLARTTPSGIAHDGSGYVSVSAGGPVPFQRLDANGAPMGVSVTQLDFRSVFTDPAGALFARAAGSSIIYRETAPGVLTPFVTLAGATPDYQASVVLNGSGTEYVAMYAGAVSRWALDGHYLGETLLAGFGAAGENDHPQRRALAAAGDVLLTYNPISQTLSAWDSTGSRRDTITLLGAGVGRAAGMSLSFADGLVFLAGDDGQWRGYDVGLGRRVLVPEPAGLVLFATALAGLHALLRRRHA